jgi:hypothetical protein
MRNLKLGKSALYQPSDYRVEQNKKHIEQTGAVTGRSPIIKPPAMADGANTNRVRNP